MPDFFDTNGPYERDKPLLQLLNLPQWTSTKLYEEVFIGEVCPYLIDDARNPTSIKIYVKCAPAQFYRFEIVRVIDSSDDTGAEALEMSTGSGALSDFWPMALALASNSVNVTAPKRVTND